MSEVDQWGGAPPAVAKYPAYVTASLVAHARSLTFSTFGRIWPDWFCGMQLCTSYPHARRGWEGACGEKVAPKRNVWALLQSLVLRGLSGPLFTKRHFKMGKDLLGITKPEFNASHAHRVKLKMHFL